MNRREYNLIPIDTIVDYWHHYWRHRVNEVKNAFQFGSRIESPRFVLESIVTEIESVDMVNPSVYESFKCELQSWHKNTIFGSLYKSEIGKLFKEGNCYVIVLSLCKSILQKMNNGDYYKAVSNKLIEALKDDNPFSFNNKFKIRTYTDALIAELLAKGYSLEDIENVIYHPGVVMNDIEQVIIAEEGICGFSTKDYSSTEQYCDALTHYFKNLSIDKIVKILDLHYYKEPIDSYVLIRLNGIQGKNIKFSADGITIYSLNNEKSNTRFISASNDSWIEQSDENVDYINASISVKHKLPISTINQAINKLNTILPSIQLYLNVCTPITYSENNISIVIDGNEIFIKKPYLNGITNVAQKLNSNIFLNFVDISNESNTFDKLQSKILSLQNLSKADYNKITNAAKWIQSASNATSDTEKMLFSWFAIESLLNLPNNYRNAINAKGLLDIATCIIPVFIVRNFYFHNKHHLVDLLYHNYTNYSNRENVPNELNETLFSKGSIDYHFVFEHIGTILNSVSEESISDQLIDHIKFYDKNMNGVNNLRNRIKNEVKYIYCMRNHIVHNATIVGRQLKYYSNRSLHYAASLFNAILYVSSSNNISVDETIIKIYLDSKLFEDVITSELESYNLDSKAILGINCN